VSPVSLSVLGVNLQYPPMHDTSDSAMNTEDRGIAADHAFEKGGSAGFDHFSPLLIVGENVVLPSLFDMRS